jgi:predicted phage replisome organizer
VRTVKKGDEEKMELKWIKMDTGLFGNNRAIRQIEGMADGDSLLVIWFKLMLLAGRTGEGGRIELIPNTPTTPRMLAIELARPLSLVRRALSVFSSLGMLDAKEMRVLGFAASQGGKSTDAREERTTFQTENAPKSPDVPACETVPCAEKTPLAPTEKGGSASQTEPTATPAAPAREPKTREEHLLSLYEEEQKKRTFLGGTLGGGVLLLSPAQLDDLVERLSLEELERYAGVIVSCEKSGKRFTKRTHYDAILEMAEKDRHIAARSRGG